MTNEAIEAAARAIAKADGLDFDEVCGREADPDLDECDSGSCVAAYSEDHDAEECRGWYLRNARAAAPALMEEGARLALEAAISLWSRHKYSGDYSDAIAALDPAAIVKGAGRE